MKKTWLCLAVAALAVTTSAKEYKLATDWTFRGRQLDSSVAIGPFSPESPQQLLTLTAVRNNGWLTLRQTPVAVSSLPKIPEGKKLVITLVYRQKMENVSGRAFATLEFYDNNAQRIWFYDDKPLNGSADWSDRSVTRTLTAIPEGARWFGVSFHLGKSSGKVEFLNPRLDISIQ